MKKQVLRMLSGLLLAGCTSVSPLEQALRLSGNNRVHLEQVLRHYSRIPADSLKYRAACFLIENMPGHGWYEGTELDVYCRWVDSVYAAESYPYRAALHELGLQWPDVCGKLTFHEDIGHLDSTFLITHIDSTFSGAARRPWLQSLTFGDFCEYVLPYRVGHERPRLLYALQDSFYRTNVKGALEYDDSRYDPLLIFHSRPLFAPSSRVVSVFYREHALRAAAMSCQGIAYYCLWRSRLLMCPVATDLIPAYPDRNDRHCWSVMAGDNRVINSREAAADPDKCGKIYRHTFSRHPLPVSTAGEYVPPFFRNPFYEDITRHYGPTSDVRIPCPVSPGLANAYLCVFNDLAWEPVAWARREKGVFHFKDMERGIVYLPVVYQGERVVPLSCPFILHPTGRIESLSPDTNRLQTLRLDRKYPLSHTIQYKNQTFTGVTVEASDHPRFRHADKVGQFGTVSLRQWSSAQISSSRAYRYWRIRSPQQFILAECLPYDTGGNRVLPWGNLSNSLRAAFDNNPLTYVYSDKSDTFTVDFGRPVVLSRVECLLRNDGNAVWPGHWYELLYHDGAEWCSLGVQKAVERWVEFGGVPSGALLWLRDLTEGREERIFTVTNHQVRFW